MGKETAGKGECFRWLRERTAYPHDDCLMWPFSCDDKGYGILGLFGKVRKAARVMCELAKGPPPKPSYECAHSCGRGHRACVNPRHLSWKTRSGNQLDRRKHGTQGKPGVVGRSKLTPDEIAEIRTLKGSATHKELARRFNCTPSNISKIISGARWGRTPPWLRSSLTRADLEIIRSATGTDNKIAEQYGVDRAVIWRIRHGHNYAHLR